MVLVLVCGGILTAVVFISQGLNEQLKQQTAGQHERALGRQAGRFLEQFVEEKAGRLDARFSETLHQVRLLAEQARTYYDREEFFGRVPYRPGLTLSIRHPNGVYSSGPGEDISAGYWGGEALSEGVIRENSVISHLAPVLTSIQKGDPRYTAAWMITRSGASLYAPGRDVAAVLPPPSEFDLRNIDDDPPYSLVSPEHNPNRQPIFTPPYMDAVGHGLMVSAVAPVYTSSGEFKAAMGIDVVLGEWQKEILGFQGRNAVQDKSGPAKGAAFAFLAEKSGQVIAFPSERFGLVGLNSEQDYRQQNLQNAPALHFDSLADAATENEPFAKQIQLDGENYRLAMRRMAATGWVLGIVAPEAAMLARFAQSRERIEVLVEGRGEQLQIIIIFGLLGTLVMILWFLNRDLVSPVRRLRGAMEQFSRGELVAPVETHRKDELGELARGFQQMTESIQEKQGLLDERKKQLEKEVVERTAELRDAKERAEAANRAKDTFLANISHELRTPMNGVLTMTSSLAGMKLNEQQLEYVRNIDAAGHALMSILNDVLDLSRIEAGRVMITPVDYSVKQLVTAVRAMFAAECEHKGLNLQVRIDADLPQNLRGDSVRIRQVLINLVGNAVKFTHTGSVTLEAGRSAQGKERRLALSVSDTGIGISDRDREKIFDRFVHLDPEDKKNHRGTGLGLEISQQLAMAMGGGLCCESTPGAGSRFTLELPLEPAEAEVESIADVDRTLTPARVPMGSRVLFVEDDRISLVGGRTILAQQGFSVDTARNGREALDAISRGRFDFIVMDVYMPVMDGLEATERIRRDPDPTVASLPVIGLTASVLPAEKSRYAKAGMDAVLSKPLDPVQLAEVLEGIANGRGHHPAEPTSAGRSGNASNPDAG